MAHAGLHRHRFAMYASGAAVLFLVAAVPLAAMPDGPARVLVSVLALFGYGTITVISGLRRVHFSTGRRRKAFLILSGTAALGVINNVWHLVVLAMGYPDRWYRSADTVLVVALLGSVVGLALFPLIPRRGPDLARMVLDGLVIGGSVLFVATVTLFPQLVATADDDGSFAARVQLLFLPVLDIIVATLAALLVTRSGRETRIPLLLIAAGFGANTVSDIAYAVVASNGGDERGVGSIIDAGWLGGYLLFAVAARHPTASINPDQERSETSPILGTVVLFALFLAATAVSLVQFSHGRVHAGSIIVWIIVILAVIGRQTVLVVDNERLRTNLSGLVHERTRELRQITTRQELLLTSVGDGIYGVDVDGTITFVNPATAALLGRSPADLIGRNAHETFHAPRDDGTPFPAASCYISEAIAGGASATAEEDLYVRGDRSVVAVEVTASPLAEDEEISGAVVVFRDITERREVDRMKSEFVSIVSHELRTPLTSIRGSLGLVSGGAFGALPEQAQRMIDIALDSSDRLTRLINDILDIERIESGTLPMTAVVCDVRRLLSEAVNQTQPFADQHGVTLAIGVAEGHVRADPDRLAQTLINLLGNAIKFSGPGQTVTVSTRERGAMIEFGVADQGRGIPADKLEAVFSRFTQVDSSDAREKGGTGLGLAISRTIVERLGGQIWAESVPGEGATFRFTLPRVVGPTADHPASVGPTVLVCDDDAELVEVLCQVLVSRGYRPVGVTSPSEAISLARSERPDAILLDLSMPETSGEEVVAILRADPVTAAIPVIVVSGLEPYRNPETAAAVEGWLVKPVDEVSLTASIDAVIALHQSEGSVLVVEDDEALGRVVATLLERRGLRVTVARGLREAVLCAEADPPQLLVLDLGLPDGSGFDLVADLRLRGRLAEISLIVYSALDISDGDRERLSLGDTVFLTKGRSSPQDLEQRVVELLDHVTGHRPDRSTDNTSAEPDRDQSGTLPVGASPSGAT